jgi:hypothetical protein
MSRQDDDRDEIITNWIIGLGIASAVIWIFNAYNLLELYRQIVKIFIME